MVNVRERKPSYEKKLPKLIFTVNRFSIAFFCTKLKFGSVWLLHSFWPNRDREFHSSRPWRMKQSPIFLYLCRLLCRLFSTFFCPLRAKMIFIWFFKLFSNFHASHQAQIKQEQIIKNITSTTRMLLTPWKNWKTCVFKSVMSLIYNVYSHVKSVSIPFRATLLLDRTRSRQTWQESSIGSSNWCVDIWGDYVQNFLCELLH